MSQTGSRKRQKATHTKTDPVSTDTLRELVPVGGTLYIVSLVYPWSSLVVEETGRTVTITEENQPVGYLSAYTDKEQAQRVADANGVPIFEIERKA